MDDINRTLGEHGARLEALKESTDRLERKVDCLLADKNRRDGGRKTIFTAAAAVSAMVTTAIEAAIAYSRHQ